MNHKPSSASGPTGSQEVKQAPASRAAQAAARVAARYAAAPSYSEMLAEEARAAMRAAEAATLAAQQAHAAAQSVLAGLEAASSAAPENTLHPDRPEIDRPEPEPATRPVHVANSHPEIRERRPAILEAAPSERLYLNRIEPHAIEPDQAQADWTEFHPADAASRAPIPGFDDAPMSEIVQPIYANLIQFPREVIATRKVRPRRAEGPLAAAQASMQLSIFEVEPATVSNQPAPAAVDEPATPEWMRTKWSNIELDEKPRRQLAEETEIEESEIPAQPTVTVRLAPLGRRLLAVAVDASLTLAVFLAAAMLAGSHLKALPGPHAMMLLAGLGILAMYVAYQAWFSALAGGTPGMMYADIGLSTMEGGIPSPAQRKNRLLATLLSLLPLGLGLVWALFDENHLTWHDRLSRTYLRQL